MATVIQQRRGTKSQHDDGAGFTGAVGEITVDTTDDTLRVHDGSLKGGHVIAKLSDVEASDTLAELLAKGNATSGTNLQISPSDDLLVSDTSKLKFETDGSNYLQIYKSAGTSGTSYIHEVGGGALVIKGESGYLRNDNDESQVTWNADGVTLGYNGSGVLDTTSTGINVTGTVEADNFLVDTGGYIAFEGAGSTDFASIRTVIDNDNGITNLDFRLGDDDADAFRWQFNHYNDGDTDYDTYMQLRADTSNPNKGVLTVSGTVTADGLTLGAGEIATFNSGTGGDLEISGDATGSFSLIKQTGGGDLIIQGQNGHLRNDANDSLLAWDNARAELYWRGNGAGARLATTETGIDVTGTVTADGVSLNAGDKLIFGAEADSSLQIYEDLDGGKSRIAQYGGGDLWVQGENISVRNDDAETLIATGHTQAFMYWQGDTGTKGERFRTTETGIDVTGTVKGLNFQHDNNDVTDQSWSSFARNGVSNALYVQQGAIDKAIASFRKGSTQAGQGTEVLGVSQNGINVTGTVIVSGTVDGRDIATDGTKLDAIEASADVTDTANVVAALTAGTNISIAGDGTISATDTNTTYTGGTGLTLDGTTFNVDAAQTQITSVGTLTGLTTGNTTINGNLEVKSTTTDGNFLPEIRLKRDGGVNAGDDGDVLGALVFEGDNFDGTQKDYARIGVAIKDDGTGVTNGAVKGEIRFACADGTASPTLEQPSFSIDSTGVHINSDTSDGTANSNYYHVDNVNLGGSDTGGIKFNSLKESSGSNKTTTIKSSNITENHSITFPNSSGTVVISSIAGGSINGGGDTTAARTTWTEAQYTANPNSTYLHFNAVNTDNLVVTPQLPTSGFGEFFKFVNASPQTSSKIEIDVDGYIQSNVAIYAFTKTDGSVNEFKNTTEISTITVDVGGYVVLTKVSLTVYLVEGIGYSYA